jgi:hypothetical protein
MRFFTPAVFAIISIGFLASCSGSNPASSSLPAADGAEGQMAPLSAAVPMMPQAGIRRLQLTTRFVRPGTTAGIYASNFYASEMWGYSNPNVRDDPPVCTLGSASKPLTYVNGFGTDPKGYVIVPWLETYSGELFGYVYAFKPNCVGPVWQAADNNGQPGDAYSSNAATGKVLVAELALKGKSTGAIAICQYKVGCAKAFSNKAVTGHGSGVAMATNGDCWLSAFTHVNNTGFVLIYFKGCTGSGQVATGTSNRSAGGLFIDTKGQLGTIDQYAELYVYKGCNPACTLVSSSTLEGQPIFGGLNAQGTQLAVGDPLIGGTSHNHDGGVDIYNYNATTGAATYSYSFNTDLNTGSKDGVYAGLFAPRNSKV